MSKQHSIEMRIQARHALEGWRVRFHSEPMGQSYYLQRKLVAQIDVGDKKGYQSTLCEYSDGFVGIGYAGRAMYIRTFEPDDYLLVNLSFDETEELVQRMRKCQLHPKGVDA